MTPQKTPEIQQYDILIIGAGIIGSSTSYEASQRFPEHRILLLEQFPLLHKNGSSHGNSRIIRCAYDDVVYSQWGLKAMGKWQEMEQQSGMKVYHKTGGLDFGPRDGRVQEVMRVCETNSLNHEILSASQLNQRFPAMKLPNNYVGVFQKDAGVLNATETVRMALFLAQKSGVEVKENERVVDVIPVHSGSTEYPNVDAQKSEPLFTVVRTSSGTCYITKKLVICAGAWTQKFLKQWFRMSVDLEVLRMSYFHWKIQPLFKEHFANMPVWIHWSKQSDEQKTASGRPLMDKETALGHYGISALAFEYGLDYFKSGAHFPVENDRNTDPDQRSFDTPREKVELTRSFLSKLFQGVDFQEYDDMRNNKQMTTCLYTMTKDEDFIIDTIEGHENIVIFAGGSGHAFKFGCVIGEALCHLLADPRTRLLMGKYDRKKFSLARKGVCKM